MPPVYAGCRLADRLEVALLEPLAQHLLVELADARLRHLVDDREVLRDPPLRHARGEVLLQLARPRPPGPASNTTQASGRSDQRSSGLAITAASAIGVVPHQLVLEVDGGDPLAAGLDDVLGAVGDADVAALVDRGDVAGAQPAVVELLGRVRVLVVRAARSTARAPAARRSSRRPTRRSCRRRPPAAPARAAAAGPRSSGSPSAPRPRWPPAGARPTRAGSSRSCPRPG